MRKLLYFLSFTLLTLGCNDGDVITYELGFDEIEKVNNCGNVNLVLYKIKENPFESLSIQLGNTTLDDLIEGVDKENPEKTTTFSLTSSGNTFIYRSYGESYDKNLADNLFCNEVPIDITITSSSESTQGTVTITTVLTEDDGDGIPAELEDINGNGNLDDDDTDGDDLPNYLDNDDDGDNVPTVNENHNYTVADGFANALDTDGDGTPDYLDTDDDEDGVLTRDEISVDPTKYPNENITDTSLGIADYLNSDVSNQELATAYREHTIVQTFTLNIVVQDINLPELTQDYLDFGSMETTSTRKETPDFN